MSQSAYICTLHYVISSIHHVYTLQDIGSLSPLVPIRCDMSKEGINPSIPSNLYVIGIGIKVGSQTWWLELMIPALDFQAKTKILVNKNI